MPDRCFVEKTFTVEVRVSPAELAWIFAHGDSQYQAEVLNNLAELTEEWTTSACFQWRYMGESLRSQARDMLRDMYENTDGS